tara:strand:+ start:308 stop:793 length:486 start_codon:yes stop_codon:yes gene_type:complete
MELPREKRPTCYPHELEWSDKPYEAGLCMCRSYNGGFGGQCQNGVAVEFDELDPQLQINLKNIGVSGIDGWREKGGVCRQHFNQIKRNGKPTLGYFELCPPAGPPGKRFGWKWLNPEKFAKQTGGDPKTCLTAEDCLQEILEAKATAPTQEELLAQPLWNS